VCVVREYIFEPVSRDHLSIFEKYRVLIKRPVRDHHHLSLFLLQTCPSPVLALVPTTHPSDSSERKV